MNNKEVIMQEDLEQIVSPLLFWYHNARRILPWRECITPYRVWVSEIILQQTRVEAGKPYFDRFMQELPDVSSLALVEEDRLMKLWEGLGYYNRARNLHRAAKVIMKDFGGNLPADYHALLSLPGIGDYTAGAISSIAFGIPVPCVDGNVLRVYARLTSCEEDITKVRIKRFIADKIRTIIPQECPGDFNQSLMELGATVCLPNGMPRCDDCPLSFCCKSFRNNTMLLFPTKNSPKKERKQEELTVFILVKDRTIAIKKRPQSGLLAGLYELPNLLHFLTLQEAEKKLNSWNIIVKSIEEVGHAKHCFSHVEWHMNGYLVFCESKNDDFLWADHSKLEKETALPSAFQFFSDIAFRYL